MENSRNLKSADLASRVPRNLKGIVKRGDHLLAGLSGGADSMVLLDVLARAAKRAGWKLDAMHINHQLSPNAAKWAAHCRRECRARGVPLTVVKVNVERGNSVEAAARAARYAAYRTARADCIVLAHNQDDQCETLLLRLLRGAGVKGLAAMPLLRVDEDGQRIARPLLDTPRSAIEAYARAHRLQWIEDESNADAYYLRNFLRRDVLPLIAARAPAYRATLTRAAAHMGEAAGLLDDLARIDTTTALVDETLTVSALRCLPDARARNLLRYFLASRGVAMPDADKLGEALRQALGAGGDAQMRIDLGETELRRFDGALYLVRKYALPAAAVCVQWRGEKKLPVPALNGVLEMKVARGGVSGAISRAKLNAAAVTLRARAGGERLRPAAARPRRSVKNLFQALAIPPWRRERLPFLWCGDDLVWAPGLGVDCEFQARAGEPAVVPVWRAIE